MCIVRARRNRNREHENKRNSYFVVIKIFDDIKHEILIGEERFEKAGIPDGNHREWKKIEPVSRGN